ncbi:Zinc finger, B-box [Quillaja saponaria]|uniref:Zinc finger, B-box n=1 Tax=Quillaja saponaria TaxID=32244 RepID=A0AAD7PJT8_QUISA|nr:Zinc finger, B-box [Quillaja saponaria]
MKIQCDVCNKAEASVFCTADEAALCDACDHRVHHANKLASKHQRLSLLHPSAKQFPLCDICQERRAFLFCQQDRAILCRECDLPIHSANEHTQNHNRFLLTGIKLSATSTLYSSSSASNSILTNTISDSPKSRSLSIKKNSLVAVSSTPSHPPMFDESSPTINKGGINLLTHEGFGSTSSISEYLIKTLPGWHVEDFLDSSSAPFGFSKIDDGMLPFLGGDVEGSLGSFSPPKNLGVWVPQAPSPLYSSQMGMGIQVGIRERETNTKEATHVHRASLRDDTFTVPEISPPSIGSKRSRPLW